jgi:hypothetical protein
LNSIYVRFLIEGSRGAVLHTGDFRGEPWFLESLARNPFLQKYLSHGIDPAEKQPMNPVSHTLEAIYLDTASVLSVFEVPTKVRRSAFIPGIYANSPLNFRLLLHLDSST